MYDIFTIVYDILGKTVVACFSCTPGNGYNAPKLFN